MATVHDNTIDVILTELESRLNYIGIGTGAAPAASADLLTDETERKAATYLRDGDTTIFEGYWDETEANGITYTNTGIFIDGTASLDSGDLSASGAISVIKDATQSLTVSYEITVEAI